MTHSRRAHRTKITAYSKKKRGGAVVTYSGTDGGGV